MLELSTFQIIFLILFSGFISIDRLAGFNIMLSRPIIVSGIIGIVFGDIYTTLMMGLIFEIIGMLEIPVGTTITSDDTFGGYASSLAIISGIINLNTINILVIILITSLLIYPVTYSDKLFRYINQYFAKKSLNKEDKIIGIGVMLAFLRGVVVYNLGFLIICIFIHYIKLLKIDIPNTYEPVLVLTLIAIFMGGYILRFLIIGKFYKTILFGFGLLVGWVIQ